MPMFSSPSPLLISTPSSPTAASGSPHHYHHPHHRPLSNFRGSGSGSASGFAGGGGSAAGQTAPPSFFSSSLSNNSAAASGSSSNNHNNSNSSSGKRSRDDDDDDDAMQEGSATPPSSHLRPTAGSMRSGAPGGRPMVHKKLRAFAVQPAAAGNGSGADGNGAAGASVDLGKMLASLDRPELLSLIMRLISTSTDPSLPAQVQALLPAPSLESINTALNALEAAIQQAMPLAGARAEYVWGRVRGPLNEFAATAVGYAETLLQRRNVSSAAGASSSSSFGSSSTTELDPDGHVHPTTAFAFLLDLSARVLRIERALPEPPKSVFFGSSSVSGAGSSASGSNPNAAASKRSANAVQQISSLAVFKDALREKTTAAPGSSNSTSATPSFFGGFAQPSSSSASSSAFSTLNDGGGDSSASSADALVTILLPTLLSQWDLLLRRLSEAVNQQGRMFGQDVVLSWYRSLTALGSEAVASGSSSSQSSSMNGTPTLGRPSVFGSHHAAALTPSRPSFGFGFGAAAPAGHTGFGFGGGASASSTSSFGFGSMSMPAAASASQASAAGSGAQADNNLRPEEEALRTAMDWVRDVFEREIGWLVGLDKMRAAAAQAV